MATSAAAAKKYKKYFSSAKGKATTKKFWDSPKGKAAQKRNNQSPKGRARKARFRALRLQLISDYKLARGCMDCGYKEHSEALEFDHVSGKKSFAVSRATTDVSLDKVYLEIAKCEVVCANCHRLRTWRRRHSRTLIPSAPVQQPQR